MSDQEQPKDVWIGPVKYPVWRDNTEVTRHPGGIAIFDNPELENIKAPLIKTILEKDETQRAESPLKSLAEGGMKVRDLDTFGSPVFELLNERVKALFKLMTDSKTAVVDDCWANVMYNGEWLIPHSHNRSTASVVYSLDPGDGETFSREPLNGHLMLSDPRLPQCCPGKPNWVSSFFRPIGDMPSMMVLFPSYITHMVAPYQGSRPRITLAWNLNETAVPGEVRHDGRIE